MCPFWLELDYDSNQGVSLRTRDRTQILRTWYSIVNHSSVATPKKREPRYQLMSIWWTGYCQFTGYFISLSLMAGNEYHWPVLVLIHQHNNYHCNAYPIWHYWFIKYSTSYLMKSYIILLLMEYDTSCWFWIFWPAINTEWYYKYRNRLKKKREKKYCP